MKKMSKITQFGETVQGYDIPVLNEREIRAAAGILFLLMFIAFQQAFFSDNFEMIKYLITLFMTDFIIRIFISPKYSPTLIVGRFIVRRQKPEYVGAIQKKFAWKIGLVLSALMFLLLVILNSVNPINFLVCLTCLVFLFFESVFGICLGCTVYGWVYKEKAQYCPGEVCELGERHEVQKISVPQIAVVFGFLLYFFVLVYFLSNWFQLQPVNLFDLSSSALFIEVSC